MLIYADVCYACLCIMMSDDECECVITYDGVWLCVVMSVDTWRCMVTYHDA